MNNLPKFVENFLNHSKAYDNQSENTVNSYAYDLKILFKYIQEEIGKEITLDLLNDLTQIDLEQCIISMKTDRDNAVATTNRRITAIKKLYEYLSDRNIIKNNPAAKLKTAKIAKREPIYLGVDQAIKLIKCCNNIRDKAIIVMFLNTGIRESELVNLKIGDIKDEKIRIIGKGNKERFIDMNNVVSSTLKQYLKVRANVETDIIFLSDKKQGMCRRTVYNIVKKYCDKIKVKGISPHKLRHTFGAIMSEQNVSIQNIQEIMGHSNINTTKIYSHTTQKASKDAINKNPLNNIAI